MLHRWKFILANWVNCYTSENGTKEQCVTTQSLLTIISNLRENLNLDESKSAALEAQSIEEFISEKYPNFRFENGTVEATSEEEICISASLLLYFVCVNSKNMDVKTAMCSKLDSEDQEIILKFSKGLMACSPITCRDILNAITEACGQDIASGESVRGAGVAETPPALRSLHSEVRRLQAALDAERFDRNYLQEELARTNMRIEKLVKDKEEYKLEIMNLKAKISMGCGQDSASESGEASAEESAALTRQLRETEDRLVLVQAQLDDVVDERDAFKAKVEELKHEHAKYLTTSQQEAYRAAQLAEELEAERRTSQSLRDLLTELRQHQLKNRLDTSQLECDDPDASMHSLHNASVCSEACANVVEVQLGEERAKIVGLQQQIQSLQDQINDLIQKTETEKQSFEGIISERDNDVFNLKHRINEEIEEKNNLKQNYESEFVKLNNEINELEQKLKDSTENSRVTIEEKMQKIQTLEEEKITLTQNLADETTKLENIIKELKIAIDTEKNLRVKLKDDSDTQLMKLNEKLLNRNNELVELQNNVFEKSEIIEQLHLDLRCEREMKEQLANKYHQDIAHLTHERKAVEQNLLKKCNESKELQKRILHDIAVFEEFNKEIDDLKLANTNLSQTIDEKNASVTTLQRQLEDEIHYKTRLQNELTQLQQIKTNLATDINSLNKENEQFKKDVHEKDRMIYAIDLYLKEEKYTNKVLKEEFDKQMEEIQKLHSEVRERDKKLNYLHKLETDVKKFEEELKEKDDMITVVNEKLECEISERDSLQSVLKSLETEKVNLDKDLTQKSEEMLLLKEEYDKLVVLTDQNNELIDTLEKRLKKENERYMELQSSFDSQTSSLMAKLNETEKNIREYNSRYKNTIEEKELQIQKWQLEVQKMQKVADNDQEVLKKTEKEKDALKLELSEQIAYKNKFEKEYQNQCSALDSITTQLNNEILSKNEEITAMENEVSALTKTLNEKCQEIQSLEEKLSLEIKVHQEYTVKNDSELETLHKRLEELSAINSSLESDLKNEVAHKLQIVDAMQKENEQLHFAIEEDNSNHELLVKEKDNLIEDLEQRLKVSNIQLESIRKDYEDAKLMWETYKLEINEKLENKNKQIAKLNDLVKDLKQNIHLLMKETEAKKQELKDEVDSITKEREQLKANCSEQLSLLEQQLAESKQTVAAVENDLELEKASRDLIESEKNELKVKNEELLVALQEEQSKMNVLNEVKEALVIEKDELSQEILEERNNRQMAEHEKEALILEYTILTQNINVEILAKETLTKENGNLIELLNEETKSKNIAIEEKESLIEQLNSEIESKFEILVNKESLQQHLNNEIKAKAAFMHDKDNIVEQLCGLREENKLLQKLLDDEILLKNAIISEKELLTRQIAKEIEAKTVLLDEKERLTLELQEDISTKSLIFEEKDKLVTRLETEIYTKNTILHEIDTLKQQFTEEKTKSEQLELEIISLVESNKELENKLNEEFSLRENLDDERNALIQQKEKLIQEINGLNLQLLEEISVKEYLQEEKIKLTEMLDEEKVGRGEVFNLKECLLDENKSLKHNIIDLNAIQDAIVCEKETLGVEKASLIISLSEEKAARDELETEKMTIAGKLDELQEKYDYNITNKQDELDNISTELKRLKTDLKKHEDTTVQIATLLSSGLGKILQNIKREENCSEILQSLFDIEREGDLTVKDKCNILINVAISELSLRKNVEDALKHENNALEELRQIMKQKDMQMFELQNEVKRLEQNLQDHSTELSKLAENSKLSVDLKSKEIQKLQQEKRSLINELNDVKVQLEVKVHSLKEKLFDNENLTDKLKRTYESQIDNLNVMITKLTGYLKDKTMEIDAVRKDKDRFQQIVEDSCKVIKTLEDEVKMHKQSQDRLISDFESERLVLKNMVTVTESVMEDQKVTLNKIIADTEKDKQLLEDENEALKKLLETEKTTSHTTLLEKDAAIEEIVKQITELKVETDKIETDMEQEQQILLKEIADLKEQLQAKITYIEAMEGENEKLNANLAKCKEDIVQLEEKDKDTKSRKDSLVFELFTEIDQLTKILKGNIGKNDKLNEVLQQRMQTKYEILDKVKVLNDVIIYLVKENNELHSERNEYNARLEELKVDFDKLESKARDEIEKLNKDNVHLVGIIEENKTVISNLEKLVQHELEQNMKACEEAASKELNLEKKCAILEEYQMKAEKLINDRDKEIESLKKTAFDQFKEELSTLECRLKEKTEVVKVLEQEKCSVMNQLEEERTAKQKYQIELETKAASLYEMKQMLEEVKTGAAALRKDNEEHVKLGQRDNYTAVSYEKIPKVCSIGEELRDRHQVSTPTSDLTRSLESNKTISDLERILHDKNRTITTLLSDITYLKSLMADSENKLLDVTKELDLSKENCEQLSTQLKKIVHQKNDEIAELKKMVNKMTVTENRASQIVKLSAKYQTIILTRIAEIKSNTILKELTNFGNTNHCDNELRRSISSGTITMEDLENFLETTDRHIKRCTEKQLVLQKERDRLTEVNRINESEILNLKKFLTELSLSFKTFSSVKEVYSQKLSRVVYVQRTARREILNLDGLVTDATMCKLERGYAAVMQDLAECAMNIERWVDRSIGRTISPEKIKQAFTSDTERSSLATATFQNASLEIQLEELENSFQKLLEEVSRAQKGEGAKDPQQVTVMEVRAEYEDKLNRMKAKMKQLYQEQIAVFKEKQRAEVAALEQELQATKDRLTESSRAYEEHIRTLTTELWNVGEKFLMKKDEADWLRKKQRSGSLMSLQHMHSGGLVPPQEDPSRPLDTHSLLSLPMNSNREKRGRGLHMSDEEGEVFDNRCLKELCSPRAPGQRLSELRWRNSLCPPHLKSSYPAETQFVNALDEEDIKCANGNRPQRKEVGITAYKKPGPPTPSKQAGRLSATDSELRESLRVEHEPSAAAARKTSTPSRIRALFRSSRTEPDGTPRSRRISNIFRKK